MIHKVILMAMGMLISVGLATGQQVCSALVEQALQAVDDNCNDLTRNTACYAYNQVQATFLQDVSNEFFSTPADRADLMYLDTIQTTPLDEDNDLWGIAMMSVQANVPNTLPGQAVIFMLMGDVQVENAVAPEDVFEPADPIGVTSLVASSNIRIAPSATGFVVGVAPLGTAFEADGLSVNGEWVRIIFDGQPAWISRNLVSSESSLAELPVISDVNRTPMQAFYFSTGSGASTCNEAPDSLMIQGPNSLEVAINANGVDINIGSTIVLESDGERQISITAINGYARVENVRIPGGFTIDAQTDEQGNIRPETLAGLRPMEDDKIERFKSLEKIDGDTVNYQIQVPTRVEINAVQYELEEGQKREDIKAHCVENGLSAEQCRGFVGNDTDQGTIFQRCVDAGLSAKQCRDAIGFDDSTEADDTTTIGSGAILERCQQAGFETLESCRTEFSGESDERINICMALGYNSRQSCRDAFPEDVVDKIVSCVSRGFITKAECDVSDSGETDDEEEDTSTNECTDQGLTTSQCKKLRLYKKCRSLGYTSAQCKDKISGS